MPVSFYAHDGDDDRPDESHWVPGEAGTPRELHAEPALHIQLERAQVYPNGVMITVTVRAGTLPGREAQRSFGQEVISYHRSEHTGPRLEWIDPSRPAPVTTEPWGQGGTDGIYVLPYWVLGCSDTEAPLVLRFSWPSRSITRIFEYSAQELGQALAAGRQVIARLD